MKPISYSIPALMVLGLATFAPSAQALSTHLVSETDVTVQTPVDDDDMIYVGPGDTAVHTSLEASLRSGPAPLAVSFTGLDLSTDGTYIIDYGDGSNSGPLKASNRCPQMTYPAAPHCMGVSASHTYSTNGTYTATLQPYAACMWSNPRCLMAAQLLGQVTIVVGNGVNPERPVDDDDMIYVGPDGDATVENGERTTTSGETMMEAGVEATRPNFFVRLWINLLSWF